MDRRQELLEALIQEIESAAAQRRRTYDPIAIEAAALLVARELARLGLAPQALAAARELVVPSERDRLAADAAECDREMRAAVELELYGCRLELEQLRAERESERAELVRLRRELELVGEEREEQRGG